MKKTIAKIFYIVAADGCIIAGWCTCKLILYHTAIIVEVKGV